ncbi:MAG: DNA polymerase I, partial [Bacteroidales bacterium]|nr:DNA polymerase I [Bacteroidales bacterium]
MERREKTLFLIDAMSLIFRAYYALNKNPRLTSNGINTSAILGFTNALYDIIKKESPTHIAVAFDSHGPTVRHAEFEQYKAQREATPDEIVSSLPYIQEILQALGIPVLAMPGYEADDIIGTFAKNAEQNGFTTFMMTTDKDYGQLVSENIYIYKPERNSKGYSIVGVPEICEKYAIQEPEQLIDILGIWGDAVDNIPGIKGVGEVGAKKLIQEFGSIENMIAKVDTIKNEKLRQKIKEGEESALISKHLATIILDVPIEFDEQAMRFDHGDKERLKKVFAELEFKVLAQKFLNDEALNKHFLP